MVPAVYCLGILSIGTATSKNAASIFITRFIGGIFGSAPASNASAAIGDFYSPAARGIAMSLFALVLVGGPSVGPLIGAAITSNGNMGWRCKFYYWLCHFLPVPIPCNLPSYWKGRRTLKQYLPLSLLDWQQFVYRKHMRRYYCETRQRNCEHLQESSNGGTHMNKKR